MTIKRPIMIYSLVLGRSEESPRLKFNLMHGLSRATLNSNHFPGALYQPGYNSEYQDNEKHNQQYFNHDYLLGSSVT
jgi:hypothetical protein